MQDHKLFAQHLKANDWGKANEWIQQERGYMDSRVTYSRIVLHTGHTLLTVVLVFFTWLFYAQVASKKEHQAFALLGLSNKLFDLLSQLIPGGSPVVVLGLPLIPLLVGLLMGLMFRWLKAKKYACSLPGIGIEAAKNIREKINSLEKSCKKYFSDMVPFAYILATGFCTCGIMVFSAIPGGLNPFKYVLLGLVLALVYGLIHLLFKALLSKLFKGKQFQAYPIADWLKVLDQAIDKYNPKAKKEDRSTYEPVYHNLEQSAYYKAKYDEYYAMYMGQPRTTETDDERIRRIAREVSEEVTGDGSYGDCY